MTIKVKPLVWEDTGIETVEAPSIFGNFYVYRASLPNFPEKWEVVVGDDLYVATKDTKEEAQQAAYDYLVSQILSAIE